MTTVTAPAPPDLTRSIPTAVLLAAATLTVGLMAGFCWPWLPPSWAPESIVLWRDRDGHAKRR